MKLSTRFQMRGAFRIVRGSAKAMTAKIRSNRWLGAKGRFERLTGKMQWKVGKAQALIGL
ncbi:MAG: hypothetical protein A2076_11955 [Geobacteraceae bacterium GWC2_53_11]|nr:MAG: hypothetical protein A2076_11955 [Geobacteraceae bacterium GWC2_53_11]